jgi:hypothetical protein
MCSTRPLVPLEVLATTAKSVLVTLRKLLPVCPESRHRQSQVPTTGSCTAGPSARVRARLLILRQSHHSHKPQNHLPA